MAPRSPLPAGGSADSAAADELPDVSGQPDQLRQALAEVAGKIGLEDTPLVMSRGKPAPFVASLDVLPYSQEALSGIWIKVLLHDVRCVHALATRSQCQIDHTGCKHALAIWNSFCAQRHRPLQNRDRSDSMDPACEAAQLNGLLRRAIRLMKGLEIKLDNTDFQFSVLSVIPVLKITEKCAS